MSDPSTPAPRSTRRPGWMAPAAAIVILAIAVGILFATGVLGGDDDSGKSTGGRAGAMGGRAGSTAGSAGAKGS